MKDLKLIVSEIDGIVTEHLSYYDELGCRLKGYYMKDFEAINELKKHFTFVFVSSDNNMSYNLCRNKNIPFYYAKRSKLSSLKQIMYNYNVTPEEVLYIGSSFSDLGCIKLIPFSMCPYDAIAEVKQIATPLSALSGTGVLCEVYSYLKEEIMRKTREES